MNETTPRPQRRVWSLSAEENPDAAQEYRAALGNLFRIDLHDPDPSTFRNHVESYDLGAAVFARCRSVGQTFTRDAATIRRSGLDQLQVILDLQGLSRCDYDGRSFEAGAGDIRIVDMARPFRVEAAPFDTLNFVAPRASLPGKWAEAPPHGVRLKSDRGFGRILAAHMTTTWAGIAELTMAEARAAGQAVIALAVGALAREGEGDAPRPIEATLMHLARRFIDAHLAEPSLDPEAVRDHLGVSRRTLYRLFEPHGGVRSFIQSRRLDRALKAVSDPSNNEALGEIAFAHGFLSDAHFSRGFLARFGVRPGELRAARARPQGSALEAGAGVHAMIDWIRRL